MKKLISIILMLLLAVGCSKKNATPVLNILNFGDYIDPEIVKEFSNKNNCVIKIDLFESNEEALSLLNKTPYAYDIVCVSEYAAKELLEKDLLEKLPVAKKETMSDDALLSTINPVLHYYAIPYFKGSQGICYNVTQMTNRDYPLPNSWNSLWNPAYVDQIVMPNNIRDLYTCALLAKGRSANTRDKTGIEEATKDLIDQKPLVYAYQTDQIKESLIAGDCLIAPIFSGDFQYIKDNSTDEFKYLLPAGIRSIFIDCWCVPKNSNRSESKKQLISKFLDYLYTKDIYKKNAEYVGYESCFEGVNSYEYMDIFQHIEDWSSPDMVELEDTLGEAINLYNDGFNRLKSE